MKIAVRISNGSIWTCTHDPTTVTVTFRGFWRIIILGGFSAKSSKLLVYVPRIRTLYGPNEGFHMADLVEEWQD